MPSHIDARVAGTNGAHWTITVALVLGSTAATAASDGTTMPMPSSMNRGRSMRAHIQDSDSLVYDRHP